MTPSESDIMNVKALLLLQSNKPESANTLRTMLIDAIITKYGSKRQIKPIPPIWPLNTDISKSKVEDLHISSKSRFDSKSKSPPRSPESTVSTVSSSGDSDDALEILESSATCSVCRGERFNSKTHLIECSECHLLYHKECHNPPITEDLSDPRVVWYCRMCNKSLLSKPKISDSSEQSSSKNSSSKSSSSLKGSSTSSKTFGGSRIGQSKSSQLSSQGKSSLPSINIISADKRLQIMKKKAAKKQDKRTINK